MDKKGVSHADWAISMGMFLVYVLSLFMIIQPGVQPIFDNQNLVKVVEVGLRGDVSTVVDKMPIFVNPGTLSNFRVKIDVSGFYPNEVKYFAVVKLDDKGNPDFKNIRPISISGDVLTFSDTTGSTNKYMLYHAEEFTYLPSGSLTSSKFVPPKDRTLGVVENIEGLKEKKLDQNVKSNCGDKKKYAQLKDKWNYPITKDFSIYYIKTSKPTYKYIDRKVVCEVEKPYQQASVFVKEWTDYFIDLYGRKTPVRLNVRVW